MDQDAALEYGSNVQDASMIAMKRALQDCAEAKQVGIQTVGQLESQTMQMEQVSDDLDDIDSTVTRASRIISQMLRRTATDKCIWLLASILVIGILIMIVLYTLRS